MASDGRRYQYSVAVRGNKKHSKFGILTLSISTRRELGQGH